MRIAVLGAGAWGTALAKVLQENGNAVTLWDINAETLGELWLGHSERYLPGVKLPTDWKTEPDFQKAVGGAECCIMAIPSQHFRPVAAKLKGHPGILVSVTKGIEFETGETMSQRKRRYGAYGAGTFSSSRIPHLPQHGHSGGGIRRRVEKHHCHRGWGERRPRLRR
jgi:glycerol-3-phosphate dehydrogenase